MKTLSIQLKDKQYDLLSRIAKSERRKLPDLLYVLLGNGISVQYCDQGVSIPKEASEYTEEEKQTIANNKALEATEGWISLGWEERKERGYEHVHSHLSNCDRDSQDFIEELSDSIMDLALEDNPTEEYP
jgi:hypothetical protein